MLISHSQTNLYTHQARKSIEHNFQSVIVHFTLQHIIWHLFKECFDPGIHAIIQYDDSTDHVRLSEVPNPENPLKENVKS